MQESYEIAAFNCQKIFYIFYFVFWKIFYDIFQFMFCIPIVNDILVKFVFVIGHVLYSVPSWIFFSLGSVSVYLTLDGT